jgi:hypothetical protein
MQLIYRASAIRKDSDLHLGMLLGKRAVKAERDNEGQGERSRLRHSESNSN